MNVPAGVSRLSDKQDVTRGRKPKIVPAARVVTIDYRPIVADAVAALPHNTPDARREVYAKARATVTRHLQLMRLPEPVIELEQFALDLTIKKIEQMARAEQAMHDELRAAAAAMVRRDTVADSWRSIGAALGALGEAIKSLFIVLGLRMVVRASVLAAYPLRLVARTLFSPVGLAAALPIAAVAVFAVYFADNNAAYRELVDSPVAAWLSRSDASRTASRSTAPTNAPERSDAHLEPLRDADGTPPAAATAPTGIPRAEATAAAPEPAPSVKTPPVRTAFDSRPDWLRRYSDVAAAATPNAPAPAAVTGALVSAAPVPAPAAPVALTTSGPVPAAPPTMPTVVADAPTAPPFERATPDAPPAKAEPAPAVEGSTAAPTAEPGTANATAAPPATLAAITPNTSWGDNAAPSPDAQTVRPVWKPAVPANPKVGALIDSARRWTTKGDLDHAVRDITEAIRIDPKFPDSYSERGQILFKMGETERAIADYSAALQRDPQHGIALRARGMAYLYRGSPDLALADLTKAIQLAESDPSTLPPIQLFYARRSRASLYGSKQQYDLEIADCTTLIDGFLHDPSVGEALKENYQDVGAGNVMAAIYRERGTAYIRQSKWDLAAADLTAAIPLSADHGYSALVDRAKLYEALGQRDQAVADLQAALGVRPGSEEVRLGLRRLGAVPRPVMPGAL